MRKARLRAARSLAQEPSRARCRCVERRLLVRFAGTRALLDRGTSLRLRFCPRGPASHDGSGFPARLVRKVRSAEASRMCATSRLQYAPARGSHWGSVDGHRLAADSYWLCAVFSELGGGAAYARRRRKTSAKFLDLRVPERMRSGGGRTARSLRRRKIVRYGRADGRHGFGSGMGKTIGTEEFATLRGVRERVQALRQAT